MPIDTENFNTAGGPLTGTLDPAASARAGSAVSWAAIFAGAVAAAALSLILLMLGAGLGLSSVSPWASQGASAAAFGIATVLWISFTQIAASGMGGYLTGRLRTRWLGFHTDEVYFRDTAHGFLAWAVATLVTASMLASAIGAIVGAGAQAGASVASGAATAAVTAGAAAATAATAGSDSDRSGNGPMGYFIDTLFRPAPGNDSGASANAAATAPATSGDASAATTPDASANTTTGASTDAPTGSDSTAMGTAPAAPASSVTASTTGSASAGAAPGAGAERMRGASSAQVGRILANAMRTGTLPPEDARYAGQLVAQQTGLSPADAERRVSETFSSLNTKAEQAKTDAKEAADKARKASAYSMLWIFVSLLIGAFSASLAATFGGRHRDL